MSRSLSRLLLLVLSFRFASPVEGFYSVCWWLSFKMTLYFEKIYSGFFKSFFDSGLLNFYNSATLLFPISFFFGSGLIYFWSFSICFIFFSLTSFSKHSNSKTCFFSFSSRKFSLKLLI